jgi:uncharacterized protein with ParB-like and HNH nuclease domain
MDGKKSSFQKPITIKEVTEGVHRHKYLLPAIQREFVWDEDQIIKLFDSLMRGYPIGSFLFWEVSKDKVNDFQFYEFIRDYHERDNKHNPKANVTSEENITAILDGQQRLTSIYIALKGTYSYKMIYKRKDNDNAYPKRKLYLNLLSKSENFELLYNFDFLTEEEAKEKNEKIFWFEVGKITSFEKLQEIFNYLRENELVADQFASDCLVRLFEVINQNENINFYLETSQELDKVLNIFIRVNSGGTQLSYSDLLLSIATAQWTEKDAREEITSFVDDLNRIGENFEFNKDFVLKNCLVLSDIKDMAFKVDNFNTENMKKIEANWDAIKQTLMLSVELVASFGYNHQTLTSANAIIPIAYYILSKGNPSNFVQSSEFLEDRKTIKKWFNLSLLKRAFSGQPDNVLRPIRTIIKEEHNSFPFEKIIEKFKGTNKSLTFTEDDVDNLLLYKYGKGHTFSAMSLLYPTLDLRHRFHQDHIFPRSWFRKRDLRKREISEENIDYYMDNVDYVSNIQLLEGLPNEEKSNKDFKEWFEEVNKTDDEKRDYCAKHYLPKETSFEFSNFEEFFEKRKEMIKQKFRELLL